MADQQNMNENEEAFETPDCAEDSEQEELSEVDALRQENDRLIEEAIEARNDKLRALAETENIRKRLTKETEDKVRYANQSMLNDFLPVVDHLEMALAHAHAEQGALHEGVTLTLKQFADALAKYGVKQMELNVGDPFDPAGMDALMLDNNADMADNTVTFILQKGYTMHDRIIRPAKVKVNKLS